MRWLAESLSEEVGMAAGLADGYFSAAREVVAKNTVRLIYCHACMFSGGSVSASISVQMHAVINLTHLMLLAILI